MESRDESTQVRFEEWSAFLGQVPSERVVDLDAVNVSTAFHQARQQGWAVAELAADVCATYRRGAQTGAVVRRLETMGRTPKRNPTNPMGDARINCPAGCQRGWDGEDEQGRPVPCQYCKPHLSTCPDCGVWRVRGIWHTCRAVGVAR